METCALSLLGLCDKKAAQYRFANESWCESAKMSEEDAFKVKGKPLCENHFRNPKRIKTPTTPSPPAKKFKTDTQTSPLSSPVLHSPGARPLMKKSATQTEDNKVRMPGVNNAELEKFLNHRFGMTI